MSTEIVPARTITLSDGTVRSADPAVRLQEAKANMRAVVAGAVISATEQSKIAAFNAEQVAAGKQMTGEQATRHAAQTQQFADRLAFAKALEPHLDKAGRVSSDILNRCLPLLHGYRLPPGITVCAQSVFVMTEVCREAKFSQAIVDQYIAAEIRLGIFK